MISNPLAAPPDPRTLGTRLHACVADLFPLCRSITGAGVRETLARLGAVVPLTVHEVPSGTAVYDWVVPDEWNVRDAWVKNARGERVIDFRRSNLHLVNYSVPLHVRMPLAQLRPHLFSLPDQPDAVPYRTAYYRQDWGFCLSQRQLDALPDQEYEVCIDTTLMPGSLTFGEACIAGTSTEEILVSCHVCHPSLANDNLSGVAIAAHLAAHLRSLAPRYTYRFLFIPATIGAITWLARNQPVLPHIRHGLVLAGLGDPGPLSYKKSRRGDAEVDRAAAHVLGQAGAHQLFDFSPDGYDERQFCSPGFDLPVGRLSRSVYGSYPEYHTSADNLEFVRPDQLADAFAACLEIFAVLENNRAYVNQNPHGEPQLGRRGLYDATGTDPVAQATRAAMLWVLNLSDGRHDLLAIAERSGLGFAAIARAVALLCEHGLLKEESE